MKPIYLDYNATTPIAPEVADAMRPFLVDGFGNPSSSHWYGVQTKKAIEQARAQVAALLGCRPDEIIFTGGGSESNNLAIKGVALAYGQKGNHIITSSIEHPAVIQVCEYLERNGFSVTYLPVNNDGEVAVSDVKKAITPQTILITIMHANNEVGTIQPISEISEMAEKYGTLVHTDAAQSVGKIPARIDALGVDLLSVAGHKLYAPKGIGALYIRHGVELVKQIHGADHEQDLRAGTENVLEIVGLGTACEIVARDMDANMVHMRAMKDRLHNGLTERLGDSIRLNGPRKNRLPNTLSVGFRNMEANTLLSEIEDRVAASAGAACHTDSVDVSAVLTAMNIPMEFAMGTIRFSTGRMTTKAEIDDVIDVVAEAVERLAAPRDAAFIPMEEDGGDIKLTRFTQGLGCACKIRPQYLEKMLSDLPIPQDAAVMVGVESADDAAVYRLDDDTAVILTTDFFTPIVDDPYHFGAIAAANAFSDIYAMGGIPLFALNIVGFPTGRLPITVLKQILKGAQDKSREAGVPILGGHSVEDTKPKYGLVVLGKVHPDRVWTNSSALPGDALILTKPIGLGVISTAVKRGMADAETEAEAIRVMSELNGEAARVCRQYTVHACTDVTGFGLAGHLLEMTRAAGVDAVVHADHVPVIEKAGDLARLGAVPGGTLNNMEYVAGMVVWSQSVPKIEKILLCDAQTSGGLLAAVPEDEAAAVVEDLKAKGIFHAAVVGRITEKGTGKITVKFGNR